MSRVYRAGHWVANRAIKPHSMFGFVYLITNRKTGKMYVGKKQFFEYRKGKKHKESNWKSYTGSNIHLNKDIKAYGIRNFTFEILEQAPTRGWLTYLEANYQHKRDVLTSVDKNGDRAYYNAQIPAVRFVPAYSHYPKGVKQLK